MIFKGSKIYLGVFRSGRGVVEDVPYQTGEDKVGYFRCFSTLDRNSYVEDGFIYVKVYEDKKEELEKYQCHEWLYVNDIIYIQRKGRVVVMGVRANRGTRKVRKDSNRWKR